MNLKYIALLVVGLGLPSAVAAQTVHLLDVKVADRKNTYILGEKIMLTPLTPPPDSLHVRVFFDSIAHLKAYKADRDKCVRYYTNILWGIGYPNSIRLDPIHDLVRRGSHGKPVTVTLVFEDLNNPEPGGFGLKPDSVANYFRYAFEIQIVPSETQETFADKVAPKFVEMLHQSGGAVSPTPSLAPESTVMPPPPPCFKVEPLVSDKAPDSGAAILEATMSSVSCEDQPAATPLNPGPAGL